MHGRCVALLQWSAVVAAFVAENRHRRDRTVAQRDAGQRGLVLFLHFQSIPRGEPGVMVRRRRWQYGPPLVYMD